MTLSCDFSHSTNGRCMFQVDYVDASRNQVVLKMIPRIDYSRKRGVLRDAEEDKKAKRKAKRRPPAKLFDPDAVRCVYSAIPL